jgi:hypothetical protein
MPEPQAILLLYARMRRATLEELRSVFQADRAEGLAAGDAAAVAFCDRRLALIQRALENKSPDP